jgi:hypothetical protein
MRESKHAHTVGGRIPHLRVQFGAHLIAAPVKVTVRPDIYHNARAHAVINQDGRYLHVLPGGGMIAGKVA